MRILQVIPSLDEATGGPARVAVGLASGLVAVGHSATVASLDWGVRIPPRPDVEIILFPPSAPRRFAWSRAFGSWAKRHVRDFDVAIIHSPYAGTTVAASRACARSGVPFLFRPHGAWNPIIYDQHRLRNWLIRLAYQDRIGRRASAVIWTAPAERDQSRVQTKGAVDLVLPIQGVDTEELEQDKKPGALQEAFPELEGRPYALFLGRLDSTKGIDDLLEAFAIINGLFPDIALVLAGPDYGMATQLQHVVKERNLSSCVVFTGMLKGAERLDALQGATVFVLPSHSESFGIAALEALALGVPTVLSQRAGLASLIRSERVAFIVPDSVQGLVDGLIEVLGDLAAARARAARGASLARERFSWPGIAAGVVERIENEGVFRVGQSFGTDSGV